MPQDKAHILLCEDDSFLSEIYRQAFEEEGYKVTVVENGDTVVKEAKKKKPDLIILEILLPRLDGFTVMKNLRETKETKHIPIVLLTNLGEREDVKKGFELGASDYIIKSRFKPHEMVEKVAAILPKNNSL